MSRERPSRERLDTYPGATRAHRTAPQRASGELLIAVAIIEGPQTRRDRGGWHGQQCPATGQLDRPVAVAEQPVMADPLQPPRQHVQEEAADELVGIEAHPFRGGFLAVVLPAKRDLALV